MQMLIVNENIASLFGTVGNIVYLMNTGVLAGLNFMSAVIHDLEKTKIRNHDNAKG